MKILTRAFVILTVFVVLAGIVTVSVNLVASVAVSIGLIDSPEKRASDEAASQNASPEPEEERSSPEDFNLFAYAVRWVLSVGKNMFIIATPVFAIVIPKTLFAKLRKRI